MQNGVGYLWQRWTDEILQGSNHLSTEETRGNALKPSALQNHMVTLPQISLLFHQFHMCW
jgi:hypothetical protein